MARLEREGRYLAGLACEGFGARALRRHAAALARDAALLRHLARQADSKNGSSVAAPSA